MSISRGAPIHLSRPTAAFTLALAAMIAQPAAAQCQYAVVEPVIQGPNCQFSGPQPTIPLGMNNKGEVVGYYWNCSDANINHAFLWKPGVGLTTLPTPDGVASAFASDINDAGFIVGGHRILGVGWKGFIRHPDTGEYTYLDALHDGFGVIQTVSTANAINNANPPAVAGSRVVTPPGQSPLLTQAVVWLAYGKDGNEREVVVDLGDLGLGPNSSARRINEESSKIVGWTGTQFSPVGFLVDIAANPVSPVLFNESQGFVGPNSNAFAITSKGEVGGAGSLDGGVSNGFIWQDGNIIATVTPLAGYSGSSVSAMNDLGQALIRSTPGNALSLWQHGTHIPLGDLILASPSAINWPGEINNAAQILARGNVGGKTIGILLAPVGRPASDLNADCVTNVHDLLILLNQWGPCKTEVCPADLTGNGAVGVPDLLILLANWS